METEQETEKARSARRLQQINSFLASPEFARISAIQRDVAKVTNSAELDGLLTGMDLSEESPFSPIRDLWFLLLAEVAFVQLRNPATTQHIPTASCLEQVRDFAEMRMSHVQDPGMYVQYTLLSGMEALVDNRTEESLAHLAEFEGITKPFGLPQDAEYTTRMRDCVRTGKVEAAQDLFARRMSGMFGDYFREVMQAVERKLRTFRFELDQ